MPTVWCHRHHWDSPTKVSSALWIDLLPFISLLHSPCPCQREGSQQTGIRETECRNKLLPVMRTFSYPKKKERKIKEFKPVPLKYHLPTHKHTYTHGRGQKFCATISKVSNLSTLSPHTNIKTQSLPSAWKLAVKRSRHLSRVPHSRQSFRRSKQALSSKKQPVGPWRKWQPYLHAIFHLIISNLCTA